MKEFGKLKTLVVGIALGAVLTGGAVFAANSSYGLSFFQAKIVINGAEKQGSDKAYHYFNGQTHVPTALSYNGTTYVPLRFFSEALNQAVKYDAKTSTIFVGQAPTDGKVDQYMSDILKPFFMESLTLIEYNKSMGIAGSQYIKGYSLVSLMQDGRVTFNLGGKYTSITGLIGLDDSANYSNATIQVFGDEKLIKTIEIKTGSLASALELDVSGVSKLDIAFKTGSKLALVDLKIK